MDASPTAAGGQTRREFLKTTVSATVVGAAGSLLEGCSGIPPTMKPEGTVLPWHRRVLRWGQTNITEIDPRRYDIEWWRQYWKRTCTQGVIINAGGIVAYYPSKFALHRQAGFLNGRDLYGELAAAAHADGLAVLARMDSNRAHADFHRAHPDWFAVDESGQPFRAGELYVACINSPYYEEYLPEVLREIIERTRPEGIADNSWSGLDRNSICHCENCAKWDNLGSHLVIRHFGLVDCRMSRCDPRSDRTAATGKPSSKCCAARRFAKGRSSPCVVAWSRTITRKWKLQT